MSNDEKTMGALCHFLALTGFVIPFGNILGPLIIWLVKKNESAFVDQQGRESLNFQLNVMVWALISGVLVFVLIGVLLIFVVMVVMLVFTIIGGVRASNGESYKYPLPIFRLF